jgi:hypothetical protein
MVIIKADKTQSTVKGQAYMSLCALYGSTKIFFRTKTKNDLL